MPTETGPANPTAASTAHERRRLDRSLLHGIAWTGGLKWLTQGFSWASTLVIARILTPGDYGIVGMATLYIGLVQLVNEFGLGAAIVRRRDLTAEQISAVGGVSVAIGACLWVLSLPLAFPIAWFFGEPRVRWLIAALGIVFFTTGVKVLPKSLLARELQFRKIATIDATEAAVTALMTLVLALMGYRYWSLAIGAILGSLTSALLAVQWRPQPLAWPRSYQQIAGAVSFGSHIVVSRMAWYLYSNADFAVVGRVLGPQALGAYNFGWTIASIPVDRISGMVSQVTPAVFSAVQNDAEALRRYLLRLSEGLAFVTFPLSVGLALVADDFVFVVLGPNWQAAVLPLRLLAFYGGFRSITTMFPHVLQAVGQSRRAMNISLLALAILPPLFYTAAKFWGSGGVAAAWIVGFPLVMIPAYRAVFEVTQLRLGQYLRALRPALLGSLIMAVVVLGMREFLFIESHRAARLAVEVIAGAATYITVMYAGFGSHIKTYVGLLKKVRE